jgi:DNA-binding FadR family transcriptional regulator
VNVPVANTALLADVPGRHPRRFMHVAQQLLESIHTGKLTPGDALPPDRTLAIDFAVSRPTVREALLALELLGVIEIRHGSGVYVCDQTLGGVSSKEDAWFAASTSALFEARTAVEPKIARLCAVRLRPADVRRLAASVNRAQKAIDSNADYAVFIDLQMEFHQLLSDGCTSPLLADINAHLMSMEEHPLWALLNQHILRTREQRQTQVDEHKTIVEHVKRGDGAAAAAAMRDHITDLGRSVIGSDWIV